MSDTYFGHCPYCGELLGFGHLPEKCEKGRKYRESSPDPNAHAPVPAPAEAAKEPCADCTRVVDYCYGPKICQCACHKAISRVAGEGEGRPPVDRVSIEVFQHDWVPGFAAFHDDGEINETAKAHVILNLGSLLTAIKAGDLPASDLPYIVAECLMHEAMHALEAWAGVEFSEERVEALLEAYWQKYGGGKGHWRYDPEHPNDKNYAANPSVQEGPASKFASGRESAESEQNKAGCTLEAPSLSNEPLAKEYGDTNTAGGTVPVLAGSLGAPAPAQPLPSAPEDVIRKFYQHVDRLRDRTPFSAKIAPLRDEKLFKRMDEMRGK